MPKLRFSYKKFSSFYPNCWIFTFLDIFMTFKSKNTIFSYRKGIILSSYFQDLIVFYKIIKLSAVKPLASFFQYPTLSLCIPKKIHKISFFFFLLRALCLQYFFLGLKSVLMPFLVIKPRFSLVV